MLRKIIALHKVILLVSIRKIVAVGAKCTAQFFRDFSPCVTKLASKPRIVNLSFRHHLSLKFCTASLKFFKNLAEKKSQ